MPVDIVGRCPNLSTLLGENALDAHACNDIVDVIHIERDGTGPRSATFNPPARSARELAPRVG
jgi:hypothetical protein